jgi:hypothetical protein
MSEAKPAMAQENFASAGPPTSFAPADFSSDEAALTAFLRQRRVVDDKKPGIVPYQTVGLLQECSLKRTAFPYAVSDKMMELIIAKLAITSCNRLNTLAVAWANQACNVRWAQSHPGLVP